MPLGKRVQALPGNELLRDLPLELNAVGTLSGHGFHPLKAQLTLSKSLTSNCPAPGAHSSMLSGARRVHPVIVGWSIANRPFIPSPSNDDPAAAWPRATPGRNWVVLDVAPGTGWWYGLNHYASLIGTTQGRPAHDQWAKSR